MVGASTKFDLTSRELSLSGMVRWLVTTKGGASTTVGGKPESGLFTSLPIFFGGVLNSIAIAAVAVWRHPEAVFITWLLLEIAIGAIRLPVLLWGRRALEQDGTPPVALATVLACAWAASVGFGALISVTSSDWVLATIVCLSMAAMVCGICLRNFGTPRLAALMVFLMLAPCAIAGPLANDLAIVIISFQLPIFYLTIFSALFALHRMMMSRMAALGELQRSESFNRSILESSVDYILLLDRSGTIVFSNRPSPGMKDPGSIVGRDWFSLVPPADRDAAIAAFRKAWAGKASKLITSHRSQSGVLRWFDVAINPTSDESERLIVVARDFTHQKNSEDRAWWMARHDPLTHLPNRAVLQDDLDTILAVERSHASHALLVVDVDNFKVINDTLGHDAGDALLCAFAERLRYALSPGDLVTRTGGDEFAILIQARWDADVLAAADLIFDSLRHPFLHDGRLLDCAASIGASLLPRDGATRSEIMKAADIALYAAKAAGRSQIKIFHPAMKAEVERREAMMIDAREALQRDRVRPYFQPKISLQTGLICGFEALLRWTDADGALRSPMDIRPAFDDPTLGAIISDRMIDRTFDQMQAWMAKGLPFGHVALNATAGDFRREGYATGILRRLAKRGIDPSMLQIEVTETVFLGRGADHVDAALRLLRECGVRIALDDFGTGYASLSHLNQFPFDLLKIDRSFISGSGTNADSEAICAAVITLGRCLGLEIVAEGIETAAQEQQLIALGCDSGQGFLYSHAVPARDVPALLKGQRQMIEAA